MKWYYPVETLYTINIPTLIVKLLEGKNKLQTLCFSKHLLRSKHKKLHLKATLSFFSSFYLFFFKRLYKNLNAMEFEMKMLAFFPGQSLSNKLLKYSVLLQGSLN